MKKILLLSGHSQRFLDEGYTVKPLVKIANKEMIKYVAEVIEATQNDTIFVIKESDEQNYDLKNKLINFFGNDTKVISIKDHREGPVFSIKQIFDLINDDEEILISYCDFYIKWNYSEFLYFLKTKKPDGCVVSHTGFHPHRIYNQYFAYMRVSGDSMLEIKEKAHFTDDPENEFASGGIYYFKSGNLVKKYFDDFLRFGQKTNNEYYVTMVYNQMIKDGLNITHYDSKNYICLGTPQDVEIFNSFITIFKKFTNNKKLLNKCIDYILPII
jgi:NDP-sugar pyrophosphorylase family protein